MHYYARKGKIHPLAKHPDFPSDAKAFLHYLKDESKEKTIKEETELTEGRLENISQDALMKARTDSDKASSREYAVHKQAQALKDAKGIRDARKLYSWAGSDEGTLRRHLNANYGLGVTAKSKLKDAAKAAREKRSLSEEELIEGRYKGIRNKKRKARLARQTKDLRHVFGVAPGKVKRAGPRASVHEEFISAILEKNYTLAEKLFNEAIEQIAEAHLFEKKKKVGSPFGKKVDTVLVTIKGDPARKSGGGVKRVSKTEYDRNSDEYDLALEEAEQLDELTGKSKLHGKKGLYAKAVKNANDAFYERNPGDPAAKYRHAQAKSSQAGSLAMADLELARALVGRGADPELTDNAGRNALHLALGRAADDAAYAHAALPGLWSLLAPASLSLRIEERLVKIDAHLIEYVLFQLVYALQGKHLCTPVRWRRGLRAGDLLDAAERLPASTIRPDRRRRPYLSGVLSRNEAGRDYAYNRRLFLRLAHGYYVLNPGIEIRTGEAFTPIYEVGPASDGFLVLLHSGYTKSRALFFNLLSSLAMVVGGLLGYLALAGMQELTPYLLGVAASSMIYVAVADLIPGLHKRPELSATLEQVLLIGLGVAAIGLIGHTS